MDLILKLLKKPYNKFLENEYSKFILEVKFRASLEKVLAYSYLIGLITGFASIFLGINFNNNELFYLGFLIIFFHPIMIQQFLSFFIKSEIQQFDLDCVFMLKELILITNSTKSESQAFFLLSTHPNKIIQNFGQNFFIEKNIITSSATNPILGQLDKIQNSKIVPYLKKIFEDWSLKEFNLSKYSENFQNIIQTELEEDYQDLESNITIINSILGLFPILTVFLIFIGFKLVHPLFEMVILLFFGLLLLIDILDPLRVEPLIAFLGNQVGVNDRSGTNILQEFSTLLTLNQNYGKALYQLMMIQLKQQEKKVDEFLINLNFMDYSNINKAMINIITAEQGTKLKNLFKIIYELEKIDFQQMMIQMSNFIDNYSSIEHFYNRKITLLKSEKKKTLFIILLNSFSLGILSTILPYLSYINSFSLAIIKNNNHILNISPTLEIIIPIEFLLLTIILYTIYYKVYFIKSSRKYINILIINIIIFNLGLFFCLALLRPTLVLF